MFQTEFPSEHRSVVTIMSSVLLEARVLLARLGSYRVNRSREPSKTRVETFRSGEGAGVVRSNNTYFVPLYYLYIRRWLSRAVRTTSHPLFNCATALVVRARLLSASSSRAETAPQGRSAVARPVEDTLIRLCAGSWGIGIMNGWGSDRVNRAAAGITDIFG